MTERDAMMPRCMATRTVRLPLVRLPLVRLPLVAFRRAMLATLMTLLLDGAAASGQAPPSPRLSLEGFGTAGLIHSSERSADFIEIASRSQGPGWSSRLDAGLDSRIAGQASLLVSSKLTAVLQVMVEQTVDGDYAPHAEWANLSYAFTPDVRIRAGRIVMPAFLVSDSRKISYANPWIRPPVELYGMVPVYSLDGVDATVRQRLGEWTGSLNAAFGRTEADYPGGPVQGERLWNVNGTVTRGPVVGRVAFSGATLRMDLLTPLFDGFRSFGPEGIAIADRFDVDDSRIRSVTAALELDPGTWFAIAEVGWLDANSAIGDRLAGYATGGLRWRAVTPYATYSRSRLLSESHVAGLSVSGLPAEHAPVAAQLNEGLNQFLSAPPVQQNFAIGGRWDFMRGIALKAQVDFIDVLGNSPGTFINLQPGFERGGTARLFSLATAFVF